jgi:hypothetical protein
MCWRGESFSGTEKPVFYIEYETFVPWLLFKYQKLKMMMMGGGVLRFNNGLVDWKVMRRLETETRKRRSSNLNMWRKNWIFLRHRKACFLYRIQAFLCLTCYLFRIEIEGDGGGVLRFNDGDPHLTPSGMCVKRWIFPGTSLYSI